MYSITFKGKPNPKDKQWVKIEMILFQTGYARVSKILKVTGLYNDWNQKNQCFLADNAQNAERNKALLEVKKKCLKVAEDWEREGVSWSPVQWSHYFDTQGKQKKAIKILNVSQCIDAILEEMRERKRW